MANFDFLKPQQNYALFARSAIEAERLVRPRCAPLPAVRLWNWR